MGQKGRSREWDVHNGLWKALKYYNTPTECASAKMCSDLKSWETAQTLTFGWPWGPVWAGGKGQGRIVNCVSIKGMPQNAYSSSGNREKIYSSRCFKEKILTNH